MAVPEDVFNPSEIGLLRQMTRREIRRQDKKREELTRKFRERVNLTDVDDRTAVLESIYEKLGKDPDDITVIDRENA